MEALIKLARTTYRERITDEVIMRSEEYKNALNALQPSEWVSVEALEKEIKQLKYMIDNGLGWEDMINDIKYPNEI
jgi:phosphoglycerate-specific signal transduction histidine kinase